MPLGLLSGKDFGKISNHVSALATENCHVNHNILGLKWLIRIMPTKLSVN